MGSLTRKAAIVGVAESDCGTVPDKSAMELMAQATKRALDDAGLTKKDIDAVFCTALNGMPAARLAEYLHIRPVYSDSTSAGGASFEMHIQHAAAAIAAGLCQTALICFGGTPKSDPEPFYRFWHDPRAPEHDFESIYGAHVIADYALAAQRHMHQYGTTSEQLAEIAVSTRKWAALNPLAAMRDPITIEDVLNSPMISSPLHLLDCCLVSDGGGAVILTSPDRAENLKKTPVWILGCGSCVTHNSILSMPDLTVSPAKRSGDVAFEMAGLTPGDIDVIELYDSFTITVLLQLEDLGFCRKGEGGILVSGQRTAPEGTLPLNTNGGGLSFIHPSLYGIFLLIEATRQLRGECGARQVPGAELALCNAIGGHLSCSSTVILGRD